jgi:hypothetical protein
MAVLKYYKIVTPATAHTFVGDNKDIAGHGSYTNTTWYNNLVYGSTQRITRYNEYDVMDADIDVARALDIIAQEIAGNNPKGNLPLTLKIDSGPVRRLTNTQAVTIKAALQTWCRVQDWDNRLFTTARNLVKYGDCFFLRHKKFGKKYQFIHPRHVTGAVVNETDITDIKQWEIQDNIKQADGGGVVSTNYGSMFGNGTNGAMAGTFRADFDDVVWFSLYNDMNDEAPFGVSILKAIYKTFKQKELLEDAIIIYRVQRAPERRVFYIDMGKTPAHLVPAHLEQLKNEIKQKRVPSSGGGKSQVDSMYNAASMNEDFYLATGPNSNTRIETLPAGQNLGELQDLDYFYLKMLRGLCIPESYLNGGAEGGTIANDGKVGIAYQQEINFTLYIERLQRSLEKVLDAEFKRFLRDCKIKVDTTAFEITLPSPSNYKDSREQSINAELLNNYGSADGIESLSKRFAMKKYLGLTEEEILINERMKREEMGLSPDGGPKDLAVIYNPDFAEQRGFDGGMGGGGGDSPDDFFADDAEGDDAAPEGDVDASADAGGPEAGKKPGDKAPGDK